METLNLLSCDHFDRLQAFKTLAERDVPQGYEREVLLACGHSNAEELQSLLRHGVSVGEPLEVQLRHLAQVALEGRDGTEPSRVHDVECQAPGKNIFGETFDNFLFLEIRSLKICSILASWKFRVFVFA